MMMSWCLMSSDVSWHIRDKLWPMLKHGSINLYIHGNQRLIRTDSPGRPPRLSHSSWIMTHTHTHNLLLVQLLLQYFGVWSRQLRRLDTEEKASTSKGGSLKTCIVQLQNIDLKLRILFLNVAFISNLSFMSNDHQDWTTKMQLGVQIATLIIIIPLALCLKRAQISCV